MNKNLIRIFFLIISVLIFSLSIYNIIKVAGQMSDENIYATRKSGVIITQIASGGVSEAAGLKIGDRLLKINGDSVSTAQQAQGYLDRAKPGESLIYTIERDGRIFDNKVNLALAGLRVWHVSMIISGILFLLFGLFISLSKPDNNYARLLGISSFALAFLLMNTQMAKNISLQPLFYKFFALVVLTNIFFTFAVVNHASLYFPSKKYEHTKKFSQIILPYILAGILALVTYFIIIKENSFIPVMILVMILYLVIANLVNLKKRQSEYRAKARITYYMGIGIIFLFSIFVFIQIYFTITAGKDISLDLAFLEYLFLLFCLLPISYFYTTIKYRVFDIYLRIRLSLLYSITQVSIIISFLAIILFIGFLLPRFEINLPALFFTGRSVELRELYQLSPDMQANVRIGYLLFIGILFAFLAFFLKNKAQKFIDRLFFQQQYDYRKALKQFVEIISSYFSREVIGQKSVEHLKDIMKVKGTLLAIPENGHYRITNSNGTLAEFGFNDFKIPEKIQQLLKNPNQYLKPNELSEISLFREKKDSIYCGMPVFSANKNLEALIITGEKHAENAYNNDDYELLRIFADHLASAFERARLYEEMADKERLKRELEIAREIQLKSLPHCEPDYQGLQICSLLAAAQEVGGDYYDYLQISTEKLGIIIGDVVGKGTSAAFHMSKIQGFLQTLRTESLSPKEIIIRLNILIRQYFSSEFFFTALFAIFDTDKKEVEIFRLGHNGLIYFNAEKKKIEIIKPDGIGFGISDDQIFSAKLNSVTFKYRKNDIFTLLTDGFEEAMDSQQNPLGEQRICDLIRENSEKKATEIMDLLLLAVKQHSNKNQHDDATGVIVKIID